MKCRHQLRAPIQCRHQLAALFSVATNSPLYPVSPFLSYVLEAMKWRLFAEVGEVRHDGVGALLGGPFLGWTQGGPYPA